MPTISHELVHIFAAEDPSGYEALADLVFDGLKESTGNTRASLVRAENGERYDNTYIPMQATTPQFFIIPDKQKTKSWFQALGAQIPLFGENKFGFVRILSQSSSSVNPKISPTDKGSMNADRSAYMTARELLLQAMEDEELKKSEVYSPLLREYANRVKELDKKYMQLEAAEHEYVGNF